MPSRRLQLSVISYICVFLSQPIYCKYLIYTWVSHSKCCLFSWFCFRQRFWLIFWCSFKFSSLYLFNFGCTLPVSKHKRQRSNTLLRRWSRKNAQVTIVCQFRDCGSNNCLPVVNRFCWDIVLVLPYLLNSMCPNIYPSGRHEVLP